MIRKFILTLFLVFFSIGAHAEKASDGEWVKLSGEVTMATGDYFILDKGNKSVTVEMDDWDWYKEGYKILKGDKVIVYGRVDNDFLEQRTIEASSVYVKGLKSFFYASSDDEESKTSMFNEPFQTDRFSKEISLEVTGFVKSINERHFVLDTFFQEIKVDTTQLGYNPLDGIGFTRIDVGDQVKVYGKLDHNYFAKDELKASWLVTLNEN